MRQIYFWNGRCPQCELKENSSRMRLNRDDFFECENCHLQVVLTATGLMATILKFRGEGEFKISIDYADTLDRNEFLCPQTREGIPFTRNEIFNNNQQVVDYLENKVEPITNQQTI